MPTRWRHGWCGSGRSGLTTSPGATVPTEGVEPSCLTTHAPEACSCTNSDTSARDQIIGPPPALRRPDELLPTIATMRRNADVVIVGGGIIGASIAYHLTKKGVRDILVLERDRLGSGSTGKNAGGIRLQFSSEINVKLSQHSLPHIERFADEIGTDPHFHQVGYLFLITDDRDVAAFERSLAMWARLGVPARKVTAAEAKALFKHARTDDVRFGTFCAKDGYADPSSMLNGYVARAREAGVTFMENAAVRAISCTNSRVSSVRTKDEEIGARTVVNAGGPWAAEVAKLAGVELPIQPLRRHIFVTEAVPGLDEDFPLTIEFRPGCTRTANRVAFSWVWRTRTRSPRSTTASTGISCPPSSSALCHDSPSSSGRRSRRGGRDCTRTHPTNIRFSERSMASTASSTLRVSRDTASCTRRSRVS